MATGYIPLPAARNPDNAMLDFSPIERGIDSARNWSQQQHNAMLADEQEKRAKEDQGMQRQNFANSQTAFQQSQEDRQRTAIAKAATAAYQEQNPERKKLLWDSVTKRNKNIGAYGPEWLDPNTGPELALAEAGLLPDPADRQKAALEAEYKRSQIERNQAQTKRALTPNLKAYKPTEGQTKDAMWAERLLRSEEAIDRVAPIGADGKPAKLPNGKSAYNPAGVSKSWWPDDSMFNSAEWKAYQQAQRESLAAILRKDTGAAVTQSELDIYVPMYFPLPGDPPAVVLQKKRAREAAANSMRAASGPTFDVMYPNGVQGGPTPAAAAPGVAPGGKLMNQPLPAEGRPQIPPDAVRELLADPSPEAQAEFEEVFGVPAAQFLQGR